MGEGGSTTISAVLRLKTVLNWHPIRVIPVQGALGKITGANTGAKILSRTNVDVLVKGKFIIKLISVCFPSDGKNTEIRSESKLGTSFFNQDTGLHLFSAHWVSAVAVITPKQDAPAYKTHPSLSRIQNGVPFGKISNDPTFEVLFGGKKGESYTRVIIRPMHTRRDARSKAN